MPQSSGLTADDLLNLLIDRFEARSKRVRDITQPIDYREVGAPATQDEFHRILHDAERAGGIKLEKGRLGRFTGEYARIRLVDPQRLYDFLVRQPSPETAEAARNKVRGAIPGVLADPFFAEVERAAHDHWSSNKSFIGLSVRQAESFIIVLQLAHGIAHLTGRDIDHRTFSRRVAKDSKALERAEGRVAQLLKQRNPDLAGDEPREILEASGIVHRARLLQVKGPVRLESDSLRINGTGSTFIGLPWAAVQRATLAQPVDYVLTIENPTSFWRYCTEIGGNYLALLTDGFPARDVLASMSHLVKEARTLADVPVFHWGDIDAGGVRIAAHLEDAFGVPISLHAMEPALALELGTLLQSRKGLERLSTRTGDTGELARWLCTGEARALEQEELDPRVPSRKANS